MKPALERGYYGHAEKVVEFEGALAHFLGVEAWQVICVSSGTAALHLAVEVTGRAGRPDVLVPSLTFAASFQAVVAGGGCPVACDVTRGGLNIDPVDVERRITDRIGAIMPMHYGGDPGGFDELLLVARANGLTVIEDGAHAFGSSLGGRMIGSFGDVTCFSFDSIKTITCGEGGAMVVRDRDVGELCRSKRLLGMVRESPAHQGGPTRIMTYDVVTKGWRYHMSNLNAHLGLVQLARAPEFIERRRQVCLRYQEAFSGIDDLQTIDTDYDSVAPFLYTMMINVRRRDELRDFLKNDGIESSVAYPPSHLLSLFKTGEVLPNTESAFGRLINLPLHCNLSDEDVDEVIRSVLRFFGRDA